MRQLLQKLRIRFNLNGSDSSEGLTFPLGATRIEEERAYNFALYSKHVQSVTLLLYTESDIVNPVLSYRF